MLKAVKVSQNSEREVPMQPVSLDIWDKKYRLKTKQGEVIDATMDDTFQRVARALAERLAQLPRAATAAAKQCIAAALDPARDGFAEEVAFTRHLYQHPATRERVAAFLARNARCQRLDRRGKIAAFEG